MTNFGIFNQYFDFQRVKLEETNIFKADQAFHMGYGALDLNVENVAWNFNFLNKKKRKLKNYPKIYFFFFFENFHNFLYFLFNLMLSIFWVKNNQKYFFIKKKKIFDTKKFWNFRNFYFLIFIYLTHNRHWSLTLFGYLLLRLLIIISNRKLVGVLFLIAENKKIQQKF